MNQSVKFWNRLALRYSRQPISNEAAYQRKLSVTQQYLTPDMAVMEFGCGTGSTAITHAPYVKHILAIDISTSMIDIAKGKAAYQNVNNIDFQVASIEALQVAEQSFDVIMGHSILHLLEDKSLVITEVHRMLKTDGIFVSNSICLGNSIGLRVMEFFTSIGAYFGLLPTLNIFTSSELVNSLIQAGFSIDYQWQVEKSHVLFIVAKKR